MSIPGNGTAAISSSKEQPVEDQTPANTPEHNSAPNPSGQAPSSPGGARPYPGNQQQPAGGQYPGNQAGYPSAPRPAVPPPPPPAYGAYPPPGQGPYPMRRLKPFSGKAIASAVVGGAMLVFFPLGIIGNIVGAILGFSALKDTKEPDGTHRGRGLAIGGIIGNIFVWLFTAGIGALIVFAIVMGVQEQERYQREHQAEREAQKKQNIDDDLTTIAERVNLYYIDNNNSLAPGGPVVKDGGAGGLYPENHPKVQGKLKIGDLVREYDLNNSAYSYKLTVTGEATAEIKYLSTGRTLLVDDAATRTWHFKGDR
jgi:hypothetical protein